LRVDREHRPWTFTLAAIEPDEPLALALRVATKGVTRGELAKAIADEVAVSAEEAGAYVDQLIAQQVLEPALALGLCGTDLLDVLIAAAPAHDSASLSEARALLHRIDAEQIGGAQRLHRELADALPGSSLSERVCVNASLYKPGTACVGEGVASEVLGAARLLCAIGGTRSHRALERFRHAFMERYEGAGMPVLEVLDEELGIGFDAAPSAGVDAGPLLAELDFPLAVDDAVTWTERDSHLLRRVQEVTRKEERELALSDVDVSALSRPDERSLAGSFAAHVTLLAVSAAEIDAGRYQLFLSHVTMSRALGTFARFAEQDPRLHRAAKAYAAAEQRLRGDVTLADVVHVSDGRVGNICGRPRLRDAEIPILAGVGNNGAEQLSLDELRVSVEAERVVLRHRDGRRIVPVMTTAHEGHSRRSVGVYRFLRALADQDEASTGVWDWGPLANATFLPRVTRGRWILALARWRLDRAQLEAIRANDPVTRMAAVDRLRGELRLPRRVLVEDYDRTLPVDLDNILSVESLAQMCAERSHIVLKEMLAAPDACCVIGPDGRYAHELIIPFACSPPPATQPSASTCPRVVGVERFAPGTEWAYVKLYTERARADELLARVVQSVVDEMRSVSAIDRWFFVRYADPEFHLRLRFHGERRTLQEVLLPRLLGAVDPLVASGACSRVQLDTYVPELARYGGARAIPLVEQIFCADSDAALSLLRGAGDDDGEGWRWRAVLLGSHRLLADLGIAAGAAAHLCRECADAFRREFRVDVRFLRQLGRKYRLHRSEVEAVLAGEGHERWSAATAAVFDRRAEATRETVSRLRALDERGELTVAMPELAASLLHMLANRLLHAAPRAHELILYDFLARAYESRLARR
jgi:thiopeptide-type bacteriocin biosynthesis protein